ncbi:MAG: replicative DNA helicase [bacterium]|nr:replicative DNA helicase [bacterium]
MAKKSEIEKLPPQNIEAEQSVLGSLLIDKEAITKIADIITPDDFYKDIHGIIYESMVDLYQAREPIDVVSLSGSLSDKKKLDNIGGRSYLVSLANIVPSSSHIISYANIVQKKATLRRLLHAASEITNLGYQETESVDQLLDEAEQRIFGVSQKHLKQNFIPIKSILTEAFDRIDELHKESGKLRGTPTGFTDLDNILAGLQKSDLVIIAARPSMGKTTFALDIAKHVAVESNIPVGLFSLEMSKEQLVDRLLCSQAGVHLWKMRTGKLSEDEDFSSIGNAMGVLSEAPIFIDDTATANVMEIRTKARRLQAEHNLGLIVIDYLQLMQGRTNSENRVQEISEITRSLKQIARELNIPVLALSQLSRAVESRTPPTPKLSDLRESGSIEQDADIVMFIYRESMYKKDLDPARKNLAEIQIAKHRNGPTGIVQLYFDENLVSFKNLDKKINTEESF